MHRPSRRSCCARRRWPRTRRSFPNRPIRIIVSFPPGGATDVIARTIGAPLGQRLGQNVVVDNRPGLERQHLRRACRQCAARRPHAAARLRQPVGDQSASLFQDAGRPAQGVRAGRQSRHQPSGADRQSGKGAVEDAAGIRRIRAQGQSAAVLCVDRQRQPASHRDGVAQAHRQHQSHPCAVQGRRSRRRSQLSAAKRSPCSAAVRWCRWCARASCARSR